MEQLIWFEVAFKGAAGLALIVLPNTTLRILGLHRDAQRFWPLWSGARPPHSAEAASPCSCWALQVLHSRFWKSPTSEACRHILLTKTCVRPAQVRSR